ncbi:hypothetical protein N7474_002811 [Penicillium riverlandense]|uniref:uncharacterized protein n=1 Tax=Penicillium riverlandense TaxID=1903569 RepID=UPI0025468C95|nr:uncharacterized protein N7474_002811 [Penicillium riverlandense]KAJ5825673.1 hypothetical protein N7474_002811 [Penicillium riverlandense]
MLDIFRSYYGGLICVCWSPDGKYVVTGGQDDLVTIWSFPERKIVARCQGHNSFVSAVAFDPWRCDQRTYRFGSVGDDCRLLLWDFSVGMLHRPRAVRFPLVFSLGVSKLTIFNSTRQPLVNGVVLPPPAYSLLAAIAQTVAALLASDRTLRKLKNPTAILSRLATPSNPDRGLLCCPLSW